MASEFDILDAPSAFGSFLHASTGRAIEHLGPTRAFEAMLAFYENERASECDLDADGDMLLFQWGTYDWDGHGAHFEVGIARQFIASGAEDDEIWQLHVTFRAEPDDVTAALASGNRWCSSPAGAGLRTPTMDPRTPSSFRGREDSRATSRGAVRERGMTPPNAPQCAPSLAVSASSARDATASRELRSRVRR